MSTLLLSKSTIAVQGSNGESVHLDRAERRLIAGATRKALNTAGFDLLPVIVGTGVQSTRETVQLSKDAAEVGADYVIALPPSYYKGQDTSVSRLAYFTDVADALPIPLLIYTSPAPPASSKRSARLASPPWPPCAAA